MSSFFGTTRTPPPPPTQSGQSPRDPETVKKITDAITRSNAIERSQAFLNISTDKCFAKCVTKPSKTLSSSEEICLSRCVQRYMEAFDMVSRAVAVRARREPREDMSMS